jgi:hypothetical protein
MVEIDALSRRERTGQLRRASGGFSQRIGPRARLGLELNVTGRRGRRRREEVAHAGAREGQAGKQKGGASVVHAAQGVTGRALLSYQSNGDITNNLQALGTDLVDRILGRVPIRIIEIHDVDRANPDFLQ